MTALRRFACVRFALAALCVTAPLAAQTAAGSAPPPEPTYGQNASGGVNAPRWRAGPYVVMVSLDAFRWDYVDRFPTPSLRRLAERGVRVERMIPVYPSLTFPNHYSLATGLYAEHHGLVGNVFEDPRRHEGYSLARRSTVQDSSWYGGEPLWVTAEEQQMVSASFFWVGSEAAVQGVRPTFWYAFSDSIPAETRVDQALAWLALPPQSRPHLITLYFSDVDHAGHLHGPDSAQLRDAVATVDAFVGRLLDGIDKLPYGKDVTVMVMSDHGMAGYGRDDFIGLDLQRIPGARLTEFGPFGTLFVPGADYARLAAARDTLRAMVGARADVYLRSEVPARYHYSAHPAIGDILIIPKGHGMVERADLRARFQPGYTHGWDNQLPDMGATFIAAGPRLKPHTRLPPLEAVNVYALVAELLGLVPAPTDGKLDVWTSALAPAAAR